MRSLLFVLAWTLTIGSLASSAETSPPLDLREGDVVAFVGGTHFVRAQRAAFLEGAMTRSFSVRKPKFRDLSWEGDTVYKQSTVEERWRRTAFGDWSAQLERIGATVVLAQFGQWESLDGRRGLERFVVAYEKLLESWSAPSRRIVLISPLPFESAGPLLPDLSARNSDVELYRNAIRGIAERRKIRFVDAFSRFREVSFPRKQWTIDGAQLNQAGQRLLAATIAEALGVEPNDDPVLRDAIAEKNRLWNEYWRPANWKCLYGDDGNRIFGKAAGGSPSFREEWKRYPGLIESAEERIWRIVDRDSIDAELRSFQADEGLEVRLFASEADGVVNPIAIRWDSRGRLWVACTTVYPQIEPGARANDYVLILEDIDEDGVADRSIRFAEGLKIPTGMELGDGGLFIGQGTELLHLRDTDGDDLADETRVVLSGFGNGDSHQTINSFVWSPGGELYSCQGDGIESRVETPWGISSLFQAGIWRLRPRTLQLDGFLDDFMGPGNPWGVAFDDWGQVIIIDGAGGVSFLSPAQLPSKHKLRLPRIGRPGGYCGIDVVGSSHMPSRYQGDFLVGDYHKNTVSRFAIREAGSGYSVEWKAPLLRSSHKNFRPVDIRCGPDGAVYVADWYNLVICHQDASYRHPGRDKTHGRIWRVSSREQPPVRRRRLPADDLGETVAALRSSERWERYQSKRVLAQADRAAASEALSGWVATLDPELEGFEHALLEALGAFETIEVVHTDTLDRLLVAKDHRARAYAARVVGRWNARLDDPLARLGPCVQDPHPLVRMEALIACASVPDARAIEVAALVVDRPLDRFLEYAFTQTVHQLVPYWRPAFERGELTFGGDVKRLAAVLQRVGAQGFIESLRRLLRSPEIDRVARRGLLRTLVSVGSAEDLTFALSSDTYRTESGYDARAHAAVLGDLAAVADQREERPQGDSAAILRRLVRESAVTRLAAIRLAGAWRLEELAVDLVSIVGDESAPLDERLVGVQALARLTTTSARETLSELATSEPRSALRDAAIVGLCELSPDVAARYAARRMLEHPCEEIDLRGLLEAFLGRNGGAERLARALASGRVPPKTAEVGLQVIGSTGRLATPLTSLFREAAGIKIAGRDHSVEFVQEIRRAVLARGDASRGEQVFRSAKANCYSCHRIGGAGGWIGPDLESVGTTLPLDRIIEEVLWPSRNIKEGYTSRVIVTQDGRVHQGYLERTRDEKLVLLRTFSTGETLRLAREEIVSDSEAGTAMPDDLTGRLTEREQLDLLRFLSQLGRPGPFSTGHLSFVRSWEVLEGPPPVDRSATTSSRWTGVFSRVSGALFLEDIVPADRSRVLVRTVVDVTHAGELRLFVENLHGLEVFWNGERVNAAKELQLHAEEGKHRLSFLVDRVVRKGAPLRVRWLEPRGEIRGRVRPGPSQIPR